MCREHEHKSCPNEMTLAVTLEFKTIRIDVPRENRPHADRCRVGNDLRPSRRMGRMRLRWLSLLRCIHLYVVVLGFGGGEGEEPCPFLENGRLVGFRP